MVVTDYMVMGRAIASNVTAPFELGDQLILLFDHETSITAVSSPRYATGLERALVRRDSMLFFGGGGKVHVACQKHAECGMIGFSAAAMFSM